MRTADAVLLVVDASVGATTTDEAVARVLRRSDVPVLLAATKVDDERLVPDTASLWRLGLGEPHPVSGLHGRGSGDLLDAILEALPESPRDDFGASASGGPRRVALIGKPNVGKSSLLNRVSGETRSVVHEVAGTTVDPVDSLVELDGEVWRFVDTAGLRKRVKTASGMEYYASLRTQAAIEAAEVALVLIDAGEPIVRAGPAGDHDGRGGRAGRSCSCSTSGTSSTRTAATRCAVSWSVTWFGCRGRSA